MTASRIKLDVDIPHIVVAAGGRLLKTDTSERALLPLVGLALEAMTRHSSGFPQYHRRYQRRS